MASILVHGGAGDFKAHDDPRPCMDGCLAAARAGLAVLKRGGSALDAVIEAVAVLEDDPTFNAGTGSALNLKGDVETDASVMRGSDGAAGAVGCLTDVKNPVRLARLVMEKTPHVLLVAQGARDFAVEQGVPLLPPGALVTEAARRRWQEALQERRAKGHGTVGAVACDDAGHVAAATSTGGTTLKRPGRIGDSPLIGCGTFADDRLGACSCTGLGEAIIKSTLARTAVNALEGGADPSKVAAKVIDELKRFGGDGGLILVDPRGRLGFAFNSQRMARAWIDAEGREGAGFSP